MSRFCRNPKCGEWVPSGHRLCASCRFAGRFGAAVSFVVFCVGHVLAEIDWVAVAKGVLGWVFHR